MVQRYVWFDDVDALKYERVELRLPKPLKDFLRDVSKRHDVSLNALVTGILDHAASVEARRRLVIRVTPHVRVTEAGPSDQPLEVPLPPTSSAAGIRYRKPKVR